MSKIFYDKIFAYEEVSIIVKKGVSTKEEEEDLWNLIDDTLHHGIMDIIFKKLPLSFHDEFLEKFLEAPHDEGLFDYLNEKTGKDITKELKEETDVLIRKIIGELKASS